MLSILKLLLPIPLAALIAPGQPYQPPHRVLPVSAGLYQVQQWGYADMTLTVNPGQNTYRAHLQTDGGPRDYTLSFYTLSCLPNGAWLTVKQPLVTGTNQPDPSKPVSYKLGSLPDGDLYLFAISHVKDNHGVFAPQVESLASEVDTVVATYCDHDFDIKLTVGESPTIYHRAS